MSRETQIIGVVQVKGGAGRSTLATNLAGELAKGAKVALIDADMPQGTSSSWAALRQASLGKAVLGVYTAASYRDLNSIVTKHQGTVDYIVLDGPPRLAEVSRMILALANLTLVPLTASLPEIWASTDLVPLIEDAKKLRQADVRLVWSRFRANTRLAMDLEGQGAKTLGIKPLKAHMGYRVAYAEALGDGMTAAETGDPLARAEVESLTTEVKRILR